MSIQNNAQPTATTNRYPAYDAQGRQSAVTRPDGGLAVLSYNAQGQRTGYTWYANGSSNQVIYRLRYQYRGGQLAQVASSVGTTVGLCTRDRAGCGESYSCKVMDLAGCTESFIYRQDGTPLELLYTPAGGAVQRYWYALDGRGNVVALTDSFGNVVDHYTYDLWGMPTTRSENVPQPLLYAGYVYDFELGWYWLSTRSYDPAAGRFISPDPSQQEGARSYVYAGDDPLDVTDPSGQVGVCLGPLTVGDCSDNPSPGQVLQVAVGEGATAAGVAVVIASVVDAHVTFGGSLNLEALVAAGVVTLSGDPTLLMVWASLRR